MTQVDYSQHYSRLRNDELLRLAEQKDLLVEDAKFALTAELTRRGLQNTSLEQYEREAERREESAVRSEGPVVEGKWVTVTVPRASVRFPALCPSCMRPEPQAMVPISSEQQDYGGYRFFYTKWKYLQIAVPQCTVCARKVRRIEKLSRLSILVGLLVAVVLSIRLNLTRWPSGLLGVALCAPGILAPVLLSRSVKLVKYDDKWMEFRFRSLQYADLFHKLNSAA